MAIGINPLLIPPPRERECAYCEFCGYPHEDGVFCECGNSVCGRCLGIVRHGRLKERLECCSHCLEPLVLNLLDFVDELVEFERLMADRVADELLEAR